jgi:hypothetical protein
MWNVAVSIPCWIAHSDGAVEDVRAVVVHAEHEAAVDHHAQLVEAADRLRVVPPDVLVLALLRQVVGVDGLEADEQAAQAGGHRRLQQRGLLEHSLHGPGRLPEPSHAAHAREELGREARVAEEMVVEEVEVAAGKAVDLRQCRVHGLRVELLAALEEGDLVAEVADVRTAAADDDRVGYQVAVAVDQVAPDRRHAEQGALAGDVARRRAAGAQVRQEAGPRVLAWPEEDRVGVERGLVWQRGDVEAAQATWAPWRR